jgi:hypothetical protein
LKNTTWNLYPHHPSFTAKATLLQRVSTAVLHWARANECEWDANGMRMIVGSIAKTI